MRKKPMFHKSSRRPVSIKLSLNNKFFANKVYNEILAYLAKFKNNRKHCEQEFLDITRDILENPDFNRLKEIKHHGATTIYAHVLRVAYISYKITRNRGLDFVSCARGALLHDFYLFDKKSKR